MTWNWVPPVAVALIGVAGSLLQVRRGRPRGRELLKQDLELLHLFPNDSEVRPRLLQHIEKNFDRLLTDEEEKRRDPLGIGVAIFLLMISVGLVVVSFINGGWWLWLLAPAGFIAIFAIAGLSLDAVPRKRDEKGRVIE
jgi:hypothetical protein